MRFVIIFLLCLMPFNTLAQDKVILEHNGVEGFWFNEEVGTKILQDLAEFHVLKFEKLPALQLKIDKLEANVLSLNLELMITDEIAAKWETQYMKVDALRIAEVDRLQEKLDKKDKWYKSSTVLLLTGVLAGSLLAVGLNFSLQETR